MKAFLATLLVTAALAGSSCGDNSNTVAPTPIRTSPVTETFQSNLVVRGSVWRIVSAIKTGTLTATLTTTDQPSTVVSFAVGLRNNATGVGCLPTKDVVVTAGSAPQLSSQVDAGDYCVRIADTGTLTTPMQFTITINYP